MGKSNNIVVVLATAWGSRFGGINSFSTDLSCSLGRVLSEHTVVCVCADASDADTREALTWGVKLLAIPVTDFGQAGKADTVAELIVNTLTQRSFGDVVWWIGHDCFTGPLAVACAKRRKGSRCAVIMHMSYDDYSYIKHPTTEGRTIVAKVQAQQDVLERADARLAVGPLLFRRLKEVHGDRKPCVVLVPGLATQAAPVQSRESLHAITFGRFESTENITKQYPLAVAAFAIAFRGSFDSGNQVLQRGSLKVVGAPPDVSVDLRHMANKVAGRLVNLQTVDFIEDKYTLQKLLHACNVCFMLSWHEGFGLTAWEAIGAGIPVVLSKNSGVYQLLDEIGGAATGCVLGIDIHGRGDGQPEEQDIENTKRAIFQIASDLPKALSDARSLRYLLRFQYKLTWDRTAQDMASALNLPISKTMLDYTSPIQQSGSVGQGHTVSGLEIASALEAVRLAKNLYRCGEYAHAIEVIDSVKENAEIYRITEIAMDTTLVECEIRLRLNEYPRARALVDKVAAEAAEQSDWRRYIRARSVENTVLRDLGMYAEAVDLSEQLLRIAETQSLACEMDGIHRLAARSLALYGRSEDAVTHGMIPYNAASAKHDPDAQGKAALAIAEAYRHGLKQQEAIKWYAQAVETAQSVGNVDCYLWAALGLADSWFILDKANESSEILRPLQNYIKCHRHPLETLHLRLSLLAVACRYRRTLDIDGEMGHLVEEYRGLGILWPAQYVEWMKVGDFSKPKRF